MKRLLRFCRRLLILVRREQFDRELQDELAFHREMKERDLRASGMAESAARAAARRSFGNATLTAEDSRDWWGWTTAGSIVQDIRFALRGLRRTPTFTAAAILTIALGIGANTAIFSFVDAVLLRPLEYREPDRLVTVMRKKSTMMNCSRADYLRWHDDNRVFEDLALASLVTSNANLTGPSLEIAEQVGLQQVSTNYFSVLGVPAVIGRTFVEEESGPGETAVVLSNRLWRTTYGSDPKILDKSLFLDGTQRRVIGVLPAGSFDRMRAGLWTPLTMEPKLMAQGEWVTLLGRLRPGVTPSQAIADIERLRPPEAHTTFSVHPLKSYLIVNSDTSPILWLLLAAVGLVLLIACANVANLLVARASSRENEISVRRSLGAGAFRLLRQFVTEGLLVSTLGAGAGVLLGGGLIRIVQTVLPRTFLPAESPVSLDWRVLTFTTVVAVAVGILFGIAPAGHFLLPRAASLGSARRTTNPTALRLRGVLTLVQVAVAVVLVSGAGLILNSFSRMMRQDLGMQTGNLITGKMSFPEARYPQLVNVLSHRDEFLSRVRALPGVEAAALSNSLPLAGGFDAPITLDSGQRAGAMIWTVTPGYRQTLGVQLERGRWFSRADGPGAPGVAVVSRAFAERYYPNEEALGKIVRSALLGDRPLQIVGITTPVRFLSPEQTSTNWVELYVSAAQIPQSNLQRWIRSTAFLVRTSADPTSIVPMIRSVGRSLDKDQALFDIRTMDELLMNSTANSRSRSVLFGAMGVLALILAAIGVYGVLHYSVVQRTREIGVRMALGAQTANVVAMVVRQGLAWVLAGVVCGLAGALALTRFLCAYLFGIEPRDPATFLVVTAIVVLAALTASFLAGRRAAKVEPVIALRAD